MSQIERVIGALVCCALGGAWVAGCDRRGNAATAPPAMPPPAVVVVPAEAQDVPVYLEEIGTTAAREWVNVQPMVGGPVQKIHFADGAEVKTGEMLFTIDPRPYEAAVAQAEANEAQQKASLALAEQDFARQEGLRAANGGSPQEYDEKRSAVAVAKAMVKSAEAAARTARLNLEYCFVKSPIDGRTGHRLVDVGNVVRMNDQALLVVQRLDPIYADFTVTERDLGRVREHMRKAATRPTTKPATTRESDGAHLKAEVWVPGQEDQKREGELTFLDTSVQPGTGRVKLRITLPNSDRRFWGGQFVNVRLVLEVKRDAVLVPSQAVQIGQAGPYVYVATPAGKAELRPIKQGQRQGDQVVIESGVAAGERVVTTGQKFLFPGAAVTVLPPATAPATAENGGHGAHAATHEAPAATTTKATTREGNPAEAVKQ